MVISALLTYILGILSHIPWVHWVAMGVLAIEISGILIRRKSSTYRAIMFGLTVFVGLFLLDAAVGIRYMGNMPHGAGINLQAEYDRLIHLSKLRRIEIISNIAVFVPFGFFLSEFLSSTKRFSAWRRLGYATLASFGLSLCIECLQLILRVGFFELTDLVMNTAGGFFGAGLALLGRRMLGIGKKCER